MKSAVPRRRPAFWIGLSLVAALLLAAAFLAGTRAWRAWDQRGPISGRGGLPFLIPVRIEVPHFLQADPRWGRDPLGPTSAPLAAEGCAVATAAMVLASYGVDTDPGRLNRFLAARGGFTGRGWLKWESAAEFDPGVAEFAYEDLPSHRLIDTNLLRGNPVIVRVRFPTGTTHFLVIAGKRGRDYLVLDPASSRGLYPLHEFGSPVEALRFYRPLPSSGSHRPQLASQSAAVNTRDIVIVGGTPGGLMAGIAAARNGRTAVVLERTSHIGGLPANGLGATDVGTRGGTGGLFLEFIRRVRAHYVTTYGEDSEQVRICSDGYHFEPSVAERVLEAMVAEAGPNLTVLRGRQFDASQANVTLTGNRLTAVRVTVREPEAVEEWRGEVFIDATYEGDLAAAAGAPFRTRREGIEEFNEPCAGVVYKPWGGEPAEGSTGAGDNSLQAYNYRLCLTDRPESRIPIPKPADYRREDYVSLIEDVRLGRWAGTPGKERELDGIGRLVNIVLTPNGKSDSNNQHLAFLSTDLPEENWPWPTADWEWRDRFARRLRDYTLGLLWFAQNDPELPQEFRERCARWGLAADEYTDNGNFPRQVYVREGRRIEGEYLFTAHDALPTTPDGRPPVHRDSITASHYAIDSHAVRKREPGRAHLDGFLSVRNKPYTVPYGVIVPLEVEGLLTPVPVSASHLGFGTLRMEPCWMALGEAAGEAAVLALEAGTGPRGIDPGALQDRLLAHGAVLIHFTDIAPGHTAYTAASWLALHGVIETWEFQPDAPATAADAERWALAVGHGFDAFTEGLTRAQLALALHAGRAAAAAK
jgi:hypothetical protein